MMRIILLSAIFLVWAVPAFAATELCILIGAPGDEVQGARFDEWANRTQTVLEKDYGFLPERMGRHPEAGATAPLAKAAVEGVFTELASRLGEEDQLIVLLIGHGSDQGTPKFMLDGPDLAATELRDWLDNVPAKGQLVINAASASGGFVPILSAPGRAVCTSTQSGTERNAPEFMEHLILALETGRGDTDWNGSLTWGEWLNAAAVATMAWYESQGFIATEHAILDDNGDGAGAKLPVDGVAGDGELAQQIILGEGSGPGGVDSAEYRAAIAAVEAWKAKKLDVDETEYWDTLERLLLEAARRHPDS